MVIVFVLPPKLVFLPATGTFAELNNQAALREAEERKVMGCERWSNGF